ncbi:hypothetical protein O9993_14075 [Vibrio lentus]|nr:hypothetical protein [Vibrio lentus]
MGVTILIGFLFILFNAIVDILLALIDPKNSLLAGTHGYVEEKRKT